MKWGKDVKKVISSKNVEKLYLKKVKNYDIK